MQKTRKPGSFQFWVALSPEHSPGRTISRPQISRLCLGGDPSVQHVTQNWEEANELEAFTVFVGSLYSLHWNGNNTISLAVYGRNSLPKRPKASLASGKSEGGGALTRFSISVLSLKIKIWDFPGGPVAKTLRFQCRRLGYHPWSGN